MDTRFTSMWQVWRGSRLNPTALHARQEARLRDLVAYAREHSPFYQRRYQYLPTQGYEWQQLPPVTKADLMASFEQVITDPQVTVAGIDAFLTDKTSLGRRYLDRYAVWTTSGVTGRPGIFVHDPQALAIYGTLALRSYGWMTFTRFWRLQAGQWHWATLCAVEGHFTLVDYLEGIRRSSFLMRSRIRTFSVLQPLPDLVQRLNAFQPVLLVGYPSIMALLAQEQQAGRLHIAPVVIATGGEWFAPAVRHQLTTTFHCPVRDTYGASEFPFMAFECEQGRLHLNADWVVLEAVDTQYRLVQPGQPATTVLLTNLANRIQPLIRYDLGDRITLCSDRCPCGSSLPAIQVEGRRDDTLVFRTPDGQDVSLTPLALTTVMEETPGIQRFQLIQADPGTLQLRLEVAPEAQEADVWEAALQALRTLLAAHGLSSIALERSPGPPRSHPVSGKFLQVWTEYGAYRYAGSGGERMSREDAVSHHIRIEKERRRS